jgi:hypothetical protein
LATHIDPNGNPQQPAVRFPLPAFLTETQVAERLAISPRTLQQWRFVGRGPKFVKVGAAVRYSPEAVADWLERNTRDHTSDPGPEAA